MSFTTEFVIADERTCKASWSCIPKGKAFFCAFCQHHFVPGDEYRMCYTNDMDGYGGNPLTCRDCWDRAEGYEGLRNWWKALCDEYDHLMETKFLYWHVRRDRDYV